MNNLPHIDPNRRVLGVIRPTVESINELTQTNHVGVMATVGTIKSESYPLEIHKLFPDITVTGEACPMWAPLVENNEGNSDGADYFIKKNIDALIVKDPLIDTIILGCTHYPLLIEKIAKNAPKTVNIISQGEFVAKSLKDYLKRHPEINKKCTKEGTTTYYTTEAVDKFEESAAIFLQESIKVSRTILS